LFELNNIVSYVAIARDIAFVALCIVAFITVIVILIAVRKGTRRFDETMDRLDSLLDSVIAVRDALADVQKRIRERANATKSGADRGFNVATWLFSPLRYIIARRVRKRAEEGKSSSSK